MANTHLAYSDLAIDKFSGTDPDQDAESFIQLIERKINFALGDALETRLSLQTTLSGRKRCFLLYSEDLLPSGMRATSPTPRPGIMSEQISSLDSQMDETNLDTEWK